MSTLKNQQTAIPYWLNSFENKCLRTIHGCLQIANGRFLLNIFQGTVNNIDPYNFRMPGSLFSLADSLDISWYCLLLFGRIIQYSLLNNVCSNSVEIFTRASVPQAGITSGSAVFPAIQELEIFSNFFSRWFLTVDIQLYSFQKLFKLFNKYGHQIFTIIKFFMFVYDQSICLITFCSHVSCVAANVPRVSFVFSYFCLSARPSKWCLSYLTPSQLGVSQRSPQTSPANQTGLVLATHDRVNTKPELNFNSRDLLNGQIKDVTLQRR